MGGVHSGRARDAPWIAMTSPPPTSAHVHWRLLSPHPSRPAWGQQGGLGRLGPTLGRWQVLFQNKEEQFQPASFLLATAVETQKQ